MWEFVVTDRLGNPIGELSSKAYNRSVRMPINGARSCKFSTLIDNPLNDDLLSAGQTLVKAYRDGVLKFIGPVATFEENVEGENSGIDFVAMDATWRLSKLLLGKTSDGYKFATATAQVSMATILTDMLNAVNATTTLHGVVLGSMVSSTNTYVGPWYFKSLTEGISEMADTLAGFDWIIDPLEPTATGQIGTFRCADVIGGGKPDAAFEYGTGKFNVESYKRLGNADSLVNNAYSLPSGFPDADPGQTVRNKSDAASQAIYGVREEVIDSDLVVDALRDQLLNEHIRIRAYPRQTIQFKPTLQDSPVVFSDYDVGDIVPFRAVVNGKRRIDVAQRIFALDFAIDDEGNEDKELTLAAT